jgi:dihydrofolate reductase
MSNLAAINLIAVVGAGGNIGPELGPLVITDKRVAQEWSQWFMELTRGGILVIGSNTIRTMKAMGWQGPDNDRAFAVWTRKMGYQPPEFLDSLRKDGRPIFIAGGAKTYELFGPHVEQFFIRRTQVSSDHHHTLPDFFGSPKH